MRYGIVFSPWVICPTAYLGYHLFVMANARISIDPAVMMGKPCIKGTRITVELVLRSWEQGIRLRMSCRTIRN
jgi:hypothetical protein